MNDLFDNSKTNWLELDTDIAKATNDALEEEQKKNAEVFAMAIAEARRLEEEKSRKYSQIVDIIGKGAKLKKNLQKWQDAKDEEKEIKGEEGREVDPDLVPKGPDKWGRPGGDPNWGRDPADVEKDEERKEDKTYMGQIKEWTTDQTYEKNRYINSFINGDTGVTGKDVALIGTETISDQIAAKTRYAPRWTEENFAPFMTRASGDEGAILLEGMTRSPHRADGRWTILDAERVGETEIANRLRSHYRAVFLTSPQLANTPRRIKREKVYPIIRDFERKARLASQEKLTQRVLKEHKDKRSISLLDCLAGSNDGGMTCLSNHVGLNEGKIDGTKDNTQGWRIALEDLEYLEDEGLITASEIAAIRKGLITPRDGSKESYLNQFPNLRYWDRQLASLEDKAKSTEARKRKLERDSKISGLNELALKKVKEDRGNGVKINNEYLLNLENQLLKDIQEAGYPITIEELRTLPNAVDKLYSFEEMEDKDITDMIDQLINNGVAIQNGDSMLAQIDDPIIEKEYTKKLDEHRVRLSLVDAEDAKKFNSFLLPTINSYLKLTQTTTLKTPEKRDLIDNALKLYKAEVQALAEDVGLDKAKILARDKIEKEIADAADQIKDLPGKYTERSITEVDVPQAKRIQSTRNYINNTPNAITDNKPWSIETPEVIQQRKDYLAGKAPPPLEYILMSNEFPNHTYHSLMETREAIDPKPDKEGFKGNQVEPAEAELNNPGGFIGKGATPSTVHRAINSNDIKKVLDIARKTDDVNSLVHANLDSTLTSPLERLGFDRPLSELSVDEIRGLVNDDSFHGFSDSKFGIFGIRGNQLKTIFERESIDGDRLFDEDLQNELALLNIRYKANQANSLAGPDIKNSRLVNISEREKKEFLQIMSVLPGEGEFKELSDEDKEAAKNTVEYQFLNSPFNQLDVLLPAVQSEVIQKDPSKSTGIDWKGVGWPFVGIYQGMNERHKKTGEAIKQRGKEVRQQRAEKEEMFPTK